MAAEFNAMLSWRMYCYEVKVTAGTITLRCRMNNKKKDGTGYTAPIWWEVVAIKGRCDIEEDNYVHSWIDVDGQFLPDETIPAGGGKPIPKLVIFADWVRKADK